MAGQGKTRKRLIQEMMFLQEQTNPQEPINIEKLQNDLGELTATRQIIYADFREMEEIHAEKYLRSTFDMFNAKNGETIRVSFCVLNTLVGSVIDQFGQGIRLKEYDGEHMQFTAEIQETNMFFGWLSRFTYDQMHILKPMDLIERYKLHLKKIMEGYSTEAASEETTEESTNAESTKTKFDT